MQGQIARFSNVIAPRPRRGQTPRHKLLSDNGWNIQSVIAILFWSLPDSPPGSRALVDSATLEKDFGSVPYFSLSAFSA